VLTNLILWPILGCMTTPSRSPLLQEAARRYRNALFPVALTGAGISVESGIPDFRSPGGLWTRYSPQEYATIDAFLEDPHRAWEFFRALGATLKGKMPNRAHEALVRLERENRLGGIITQNIDGLHEMAGSSHVMAIHGSWTHVQCINCGVTTRSLEHHESGGIPRCSACGTYLKPDVVLFGEPVRTMDEIQELVKKCDAMLVIGTSGEVYPAAAFPRQVRKRGGLILEFNLLAHQREKQFEKTLFITRGGGVMESDYFFEGPATLTLSSFTDEVVRQGAAF